MSLISRRWIPLLILGIGLGAACAPAPIRYTTKGDERLQRSDTEGAIRSYAKALRKDPGYAPAHYRLGQVAMAHGKWERAVDFFSDAISSDEAMSEAHLARGLAYIELNVPDAARTDLLRAFELGDDRAAVYAAIYKYLDGDFPGAFRALEKAASIQDDVPLASRYIFKSALRSRDYPEGRRLLERCRRTLEGEPSADADGAGDESAEREAVEPEGEALEHGDAAGPEEDDPLASLGLPSLDAWQKARAAARLWRMQAELAYLDGDFTGAFDMERKAPTRFYFGLWYRDPSLDFQRSLGSIRGAVVEYVHMGSPAMTAGIEVGDVITSFERTPIHSAEELDRALENYEERVTHERALFEILRGNQQLAFRLEPGVFRTRDYIETAASGVGVLTFKLVDDALIRQP